MTPTILLAGASVRAAAASAMRAGLQPWCVDLFGDVDLQRACPTRRVERYPDDLVAALADAPDVPWIYTGSLENFPDLVDRVRRPLWGNGGNVLRRVRSPFALADALQKAGLPGPKVRTEPDAGRWLIKPYRSGAGINVKPYQPGGPLDATTSYLQEWIDGEPYSALFLADHNGLATLCGVSRQLIGIDWLHADGYLYCGNVAPVSVPFTTQRTLEAIGNVLVASFQIRGTFGIDFILKDDVAYVVEVNPRFPASLEVYERVGGVSLFIQHAAAFEPSLARQVSWTPSPWKRCVKGILYARESIHFPAAGPWLKALQRPFAAIDLPFADIPAAGTPIAKGTPVLTLFADADSDAEAVSRLHEIANDLDRWLYGR